MRRSVLSGIAIVLFVVAALQLFLWYDTRQLMDRWITQLAPYASVRYRGVHASPLGSIGLNEVRISPVGSDETYSIERFRLRTPGPLEFLKARRALKDNRLPPEISLSLEKLQAGLYGEASMLLMPFSLAYACGDKASLQPEDFAALGIEEVSLDLGVSLAKLEEGLSVDLSLDLEQLADMRLRMQMDSMPGTVSTLRDNVPTPSTVAFSMRDRGFNQHKLGFCAERTGTSIPRFISRHIEAVQTDLGNFVVLENQDLFDGYARFIAADRGVIELNLESQQKLESPLTPPNWLAWLSGAEIDLAVNGRPPTDLRLALEPQHQGSSVSDAPSSTDPAPVAERAVFSETSTGRMASLDLARVSAIAVATEETNASASMEVSFRELPREDLDLHIGKKVIVDTVNGNQHRGFIEGFERGRLTIRIPLQNGSVAIPVRSDGIAQIQVQTE